MATTSREDRFIENEELFRKANERLRDRAEVTAAPGRSIPFICECIDETCMARIDLTLEDYERVRSDDDHFVIAPGHPQLDGERVVEEEDHFLIVTKEDLN
jgi:hypothetical protein